MENKWLKQLPCNFRILLPPPSVGRRRLCPPPLPPLIHQTCVYFVTSHLSNRSSSDGGRREKIGPMTNWSSSWSFSRDHSSSTLSLTITGSAEWHSRKVQLSPQGANQSGCQIISQVFFLLKIMSIANWIRLKYRRPSLLRNGTNEMECIFSGTLRSNEELRCTWNLKIKSGKKQNKRKLKRKIKGTQK